MTEDKSRRAIDLGMKAKGLLENETLNKWWESADLNLFNKFKEAKISDTARLIEIKALCDAQKAMKKDFIRYVSGGETAKSKLGNKKPKIPNPFE